MQFFQRVVLFICLIAFILSPKQMFAPDSDTATVNYQIDAINEILISGDPGTLTINTATAGSQPDDATDSTTTYAITTNETNKKITGAIDSNMPANTTLQVNLTAPGGATSAGDVTMTTVAADLVTSISNTVASLLTITYTFSATVDAGPQSGSRILTYTIVDGP